MRPSPARRSCADWATVWKSTTRSSRPSVAASAATRVTPGALGIFEVVIINDPVREAIANRASSAKIAEVLGDEHMPMWEDGYRKATAGQTTLNEVLRVTQDV